LAYARIANIERNTPVSNTLIKAHAVNVIIDERSILSNISLCLDAGHITSLIGPNGAGKTTLTKTLLGLQKPSSGLVTKRPGLRIGYMPQQLHVDQNLPLTVERFLSLANSEKGRVTQALTEAGAAQIKSHSLSKISGGEMQRVLLARALLRDPQLLVLDEPARGVDIAGQEELYSTIANIRERHGCGVLLVSHDLHLVMAKTDSVICLNRHVCCQGRPEEISTDPAYLDLFGQNRPAALALYTHHHDHDHDIHGNIVDAEKGKGTDA
jgi:zinc transport system ATP-binding protein